MNLRDPNVQKVIIGIIAIAAFSYVFFGTTLLPFCYPVRKAKINDLEQEYAKLSADLEKARQMVGRLPQLEAEYQRLHKQWKSAQQLLPEEHEMPGLLRQVTSAGNKAGVDFMLFQPETPVAKELYKDHPVKIRVRGGYHQVGIFLSRLANMSRIVNVSRLEVTEASARKNKNETQGRYTVIADFTLTAHTLMGGATNESEGNENVAGQK
jgi:type IV pilus assembly protein PilO